MNAFPLSSQQQGLWFVQQMAPNNCAYNLVFAARILSIVQIESLQWAFNAIMARHPALRTCFRNGTSGLEQYVEEEITTDFQHVDAHLWDDKTIRERVLEDTRSPFQLDNPPLLRVRLYEHREEDWILTLTAHHITVDFLSLALVLDELKSLYGASTETLQNLSIPKANFAAYVQNQQNMLASPQGSSSLAYWKNRLAGHLTVLELPFDYPRPPLQSFNGGSIGFQLNKEVSDGLKNLAKGNGVTLYMFMLATFQIFLHRYTGESDILVGTYVSDRPRSLKLDNVVANFINTVVMRSELDGNVSFLDFLKQIRTTVIEALRHNYPFPLLVEKLKLQRDPSFPPVFQAVFAWERLQHFKELADFFALEGRKKAIQFGSLTLEPFPLPQQEGQFDLALEMGGESEGKLFGTFKYNSDLFKQSTINTMVTHFKTLLEGIVTEPHNAIGALPLLTKTEHQDLVKQAAGPIIPYPTEANIYTLFKKLLRRQPNAIALRFETQAFTFADLDSRVEQLAHYLIHQGLTPDQRVGLCVERSPEMVIAMLGILKVGCAYVPLDPDFPAERLAFMLEDCQAALLVTQEALLGLYPNYPGSILCLDRDKTRIEAAPKSHPLPVSSDKCAYVIYTSGSTGKPKGVQISHRAVVNFLYSMSQEPGIKNDDILLAVTSFSFDIAVLEIFLPLITGACLVLANREIASDGRLLAQAIETTGTTLMQATPATWQMLLSSGWQGDPKLKVLCGGEALSKELADTLLEQCAELWNLYGPTEATVWSTISRIESKNAPITIGRPIANTHVYVLDSYGQHVPMGVTGELHIGGEGLAIGYLNRPELTAERFISSPIQESVRLYKTGDRVRYRLDGNIEYLGRLDHQIKLRGYRIELGEIESLLRQQPQIEDAVVLLREDVPGDPRIVAYLIEAHPQSIDNVTLRACLSEDLPSYMLPSAFVRLEAFPLTPNKKIDRRALPMPPKQNDPDLQKDFVVPRDSVEIQLVCIWEDLLNTRPVGIHDNFFEIGGHSLLAVQLMAKIQQEWGLELPVSSLMHSPTIEALAHIIQNNDAGEESLLVPMRTSGKKRPLFFIHPFGGTIFCYLALVRHLETQHPVYAVQSPGLSQADAVEVSVEDIATQYIKVIKEQQPQGPYHLGGWCFGGVIAFEMAHQLQQVGESISMLALMDSRAPILENVPDDGDDATLLSWFARDLAIPYNRTLSIPPEELRALNPEEMFEHVLVRAKSIQVIPEDAESEMLRRYFEVYIANGIALQTYFPKPIEKMPIKLFRAVDETDDYGPALGWEKLCSHDLKIIDVPGNHNSIMYEPHIQEVAKELRKCLNGETINRNGR